MIMAGGATARFSSLASEPSISTSASFDDLDDLLPGSNRLQDRLSDGLFGYLVDKFTRDGKCDVGFEQGNANFAHRLSNVGFVQRTTTAQAIKYASQPVAQLVEHQTSFVKPAGNAQKRRWAKPR